MSKERDEMFKRAYAELSAGYHSIAKPDITDFCNSRLCNDICAKYRVGRDEPLELHFLRWCLENIELDRKTKLDCRVRVSDLKRRESLLEEFVLREVEVSGEGSGCIIARKGRLVDVLIYSSLAKRTYALEKALSVNALRFTDENKLRAKTDDPLEEYLDMIRVAAEKHMTATALGIVPVILCDDESVYFDTLTKIKNMPENPDSVPGFLRFAPVLGARRYDSSIENMFKAIFSGSSSMMSIDFTNYNAIDQLFNEIITSVKIEATMGRKVICLRVGENAAKLAEVIGSRLPIIKIHARAYTPEEEVNLLAECFTEMQRPVLTTEITDIMKKIIIAEKRSGMWAGSGSIKRLALKILQFTESVTEKESQNASYGKCRALTAAILNDYYEKKYDASNKISALEKLRAMSGMEKVVELAEQIIAGEHQKDVMRSKGVEPAVTSRHIVFTGPSGCGKTTAARLLSEALNEAGVCRGFYECNARSICGQYLGETRVLANAMIESAGQGVLFLDEAYSLNAGSNDYGSEAIAVLLTEMEKTDSRLIIIFAGYTDEMDAFLSCNPGLRSRIGFQVSFDSFTAEQLCDIAMKFLSGYSVEPEAGELIRDYFLALPRSELEKEDFGMARFARNIASKIASAAARRHWLAGNEETDITAEDVIKALPQAPEIEKPRIGFSA